MIDVQVNNYRKGTMLKSNVHAKLYWCCNKYISHNYRYSLTYINYILLYSITRLFYTIVYMPFMYNLKVRIKQVNRRYLEYMASWSIIDSSAPDFRVDCSARLPIEIARVLARADNAKAKALRKHAAWTTIEKRPVDIRASFEYRPFSHSRDKGLTLSMLN